MLDYGGDVGEPDSVGGGLLNRFALPAKQLDRCSDESDFLGVDHKVYVVSGGALAVECGTASLHFLQR